MRRMILVFAVVCFLTTALWASADEVIVVDKKDFKVELTSVDLKKISFNVANFYLTIPVAVISTIRLTEDGQKFILQSVTGREIEGTTYFELKGTWELGEYSVGLSDIKSIEFRWTAQPEQEIVVAGQPDGFYAICTDWTGATMEVFDFQYRGSYTWYISARRDIFTREYYPSKRGTEYIYRKYLPVEYKEVVVGVPFADIDAVKFTDTEPTEKSWEPTLDIKLGDGSMLTGKFVELGEYVPKFAGQVAHGDLVERIREITFNHERDKNAPRVTPEKDDIRGDLDSIYTISIETWQGNQVLFLNGCRFELDEGYEWEKLKTNFNLEIGESSNIVDFDKIRSIEFKGNGEASMTTTSGKTFDVSLPGYDTIWLGGNLDKFGPARIKMSKVALFEISRTAGP